MKRRVRRFRRQYSLLTATQQMECDWCAYLLKILAGRRNQ